MFYLHIVQMSNEQDKCMCITQGVTPTAICIYKQIS